MFNFSFFFKRRQGRKIEFEFQFQFVMIKKKTSIRYKNKMVAIFILPSLFLKPRLQVYNKTI